jgi:thiol-disulfide isomerase/thioredoxin
MILLLSCLLLISITQGFNGPTTRPSPTVDIGKIPIVLPGSGKYVYTVTDKNFTDISTADLVGEGPLFIEFYTQWCGHCKQLAPTWQKVSSELRGRVRVGAMDISENPLTMEQLSVTAFPTIMYIVRNRVYTYPPSRARSLTGLKQFALGGFNEVDWVELGKPPKRDSSSGTATILFRIRRMIRVTLFFWTKATFASVITFAVGCIFGGITTVVMVKAAGNQHIAELEDELIDRLNAVEEWEDSKDRRKDSGDSSSINSSSRSNRPLIVPPSKNSAEREKEQMSVTNKKRKNKNKNKNKNKSKSKNKKEQ